MPPGSCRELPLPNRFNPCRERLHKLPEELTRAVLDQFALGIKKISRSADVGFRLLHRGHVQKHQSLTQVMVRTECAQRAGRYADDRAGFAIPRIAPIGTRGDVQRIFETARHGAVVFRVTKRTASALLTCRRKAAHVAGRFSPSRSWLYSGRFPISAISNFKGAALSAITAFTSLRHNDSLRRLPTRTMTFATDDMMAFRVASRPPNGDEVNHVGRRFGMSNRGCPFRGL